MKHIKRIAAAVLALCALLALTACGGLQEKVESKLWETAAPILVQGNMDLLYKGVCDENYLKLVNSTQEDCLPYYEENMALQAQAIMAAFEINDVNNNQSDRFIDIMKQVYAKADYTIGAASQVDDSHFLVDVTVTPLNFPAQVYDNLDIGLMTFFNTYGELTDEQLNAMSDQEYIQYEETWATGIHNACRVSVKDGPDTLAENGSYRAAEMAMDGVVRNVTYNTATGAFMTAGDSWSISTLVQEKAGFSPGLTDNALYSMALGNHQTRIAGRPGEFLTAGLFLLLGLVLPLLLKPAIALDKFLLGFFYDNTEKLQATDLARGIMLLLGLVISVIGAIWWCILLFG